MKRLYKSGYQKRVEREAKRRRSIENVTTEYFSAAVDSIESSSGSRPPCSIAMNESATGIADRESVLSELEQQDNDSDSDSSLLEPEPEEQAEEASQDVTADHSEAVSDIEANISDEVTFSNEIDLSSIEVSILLHAYSLWY